MTDRFQMSPQSIKFNQAIVQYEGELELQSERSVLFELFQTHQVSKICQKVTLISLHQFCPHKTKIAYKSCIQNFFIYLPFFTEIQTQNNVRLDLLSSLVLLSRQKKLMGRKFISDVYEKIELYRFTNLQYIEAFFKLCKILSHNNDQTYDKIVKKSSRIFIKLYSAIISSNILPYLIQFSSSFDPMLIELKGKNQHLNFKLQKKLIQDTQLRNRLALAHQQIMKSITQNQIKKVSDNKNYQPQFYTVPIPIYNNDVTKVKNKNIFDQHQSMELKSSIKFKIRQSKIIAKSKDNKQSKQTSPQKVVQNFRKKSLQHRLSTSIHQKTNEPIQLQRSTISTENYHEFHKKSIHGIQQYINAPKKLNFRAINLNPLENVSMPSSISSENIVQVQGLNKEKEDQRENKLIFNLKRNNKKQNFQASRTEKSVQQQFSDFDSPQKNQKSSKKQTSSSSNKLAFILSKRKYRKFESDQDLTSGLSDDSSVQLPGSAQSNMLKKRTKSKKKNQHLIDESIIIQYRKRRISEAEEDSSKSFSRNPTPLTAEVETQLTKLKIKSKKKEEEDTLGSTTNIESKGEEVSEYSCTEQINQMIENFNRKQQIKIEKQLMLQQNQQLAIQGPSETQPLGNVTAKESQQSNDVSIQKSQQQKSQEKKKKRKIILKASKLNFQEVPNYLQKMGFLEFDSLMKDISVHQHYICEFYLNETIFNVIVFCPSLDFKSIQVKLIHQVQQVQSELFESSSVKDKFRKVVLKNFIQIMENSASQIFSQVVIKNFSPSQIWIQDGGFSQHQNKLIYPLKSSPKRQRTRQFLTICGSIFSVQQQVNESFLYSDQISTFKGGKYDINEKIFTYDEFSLIPSYTCKGLTKMKEVNEILELKELDTFEVSPSVETLIFHPQQITLNQVDLITFTLEQILKKDFIIANGWIKTTSQLIFNDKNQRIASISLPGNYEIHFGKGFEHIGTMKNKITHYKTRMNSKKNSEFTTKIFNTKIRMFSKQLYGLIKHQNGMAYYGNWEMNFHFKHEFLGRVIYQIQTQNNENRLVFGNSSFFVTIYQGDQFIIGWEVEDNDFLY